VHLVGSQSWCSLPIRQSLRSNASLNLTSNQREQAALQPARNHLCKRGSSIRFPPAPAQAGDAAAAAVLRGPKHPEALTILYFTYLWQCFVERTWRFGLPLILAFVDGELCR
jgi:hypothetical protein